MPPPPTPFHILRTHSAPLSTIAFSSDNSLLYSGDQDGYVSVTDLRTRRSVLHWKAHEGGILGVGEWDGRLISHGRDNLIHIYDRIPLIRRSVASSTTSPGIWKSLTVNSLNFCRFALLPLNRAPSLSPATVNPDQAGTAGGSEALLAVPNLLDTELADIYHLPSMRRLHAAVNTPINGKGKKKAASMPTDSTRSGLIMSLHLRFLPPARPDVGNSNEYARRLGLILGYEDGRIDVWGISATGQEAWRGFTDGSEQVGKRGWDLIWSGKGHNEAVMAMTVTKDARAAYTVSADHLLVKYDLAKALTDPSSTKLVTPYSTKQIGNASIALSPSEQVIAVGGWDGRIRLFSAGTGKPLGTLEYHRETVQSLAFPYSQQDSDMEGDGSRGVEASTLELGEEGSDDDSDEEGDKAEGRSRWLVSGSKDRRLGMWQLMDFEKKIEEPGNRQ